MSALDKFYDFTLNLPDAKLTSKAMSLCNIDRNVFNIYLTLQEGKNNPILNADLGSYTVTMIVVKPKTKEYVEKVGVVDGSNDRLLFELGDTFNDQIGSYKGEIKVQNGNEVITSSSFAYTVTQSLISGLNAEIEASPDVEILRQLINEVKAVVGMTPGDPDSLLTDYQKKNDNTLITTDKTIIGAINENSSQIKEIANQIENGDVGIANPPNADVYLSTPSYIKAISVGGDQGCHPKVVAFPTNATPWNGYWYWMAFTPYQNATTSLENPCIIASNDKINWYIPNGLANPIDEIESYVSKQYYSDVHLLYRKDLNRLECYYRRCNEGSKEIIYRKYSTDGRTWSEKELVYEVDSLNSNKCLSPAIIYDSTNNKYKIWFCSSHKGQIGADLNVLYYEADSDCKNWTFIRDTGLTCWHLDVEKTDLGYELILNQRVEAKLEHSLTTDCLSYTQPITILKKRLGNWDNGIYRSCIIKEGDTYSLFYNGVNNNRYHIGLSVGASLTALRGVDGQPSRETYIEQNSIIQKNIIYPIPPLLHGSTFDRIKLPYGDKLNKGVSFFDTTLGKPVWIKQATSTGNIWVDSNGTDVTPPAEDPIITISNTQITQGERTIVLFDIDDSRTYPLDCMFYKLDDEGWVWSSIHHYALPYKKRLDLGMLDNGLHTLQVKVVTIGGGQRKETVSDKINIIVGEMVDMQTITIHGDTTVQEGDTLQLTATYTPETAADNRLVWSSSNSNAEVDNNGLVQGVTQGEVIITCSSVAVPSVSDNITITILPGLQPSERLVQNGLANRWLACEKSSLVINESEQTVTLPDSIGNDNILYTKASSETLDVQEICNRYCTTDGIVGNTLLTKTGTIASNSHFNRNIYTIEFVYKLNQINGDSIFIEKMLHINKFKYFANVKNIGGNVGVWYEKGCDLTQYVNDDCIILTIRVDNTSFEAFINGESLGKVTVQVPSSFNEDNIIFGIGNYVIFKEARYYNRALNDNEIKNNVIYSKDKYKTTT